MMMPANFTAVNSEVVYGGADLFSILADTTAPVWGAANVKKFNTNLITLVSNTFFQTTVSNTLGTMFSGNWGKDGVKLFGDDGTAHALFNNQFKYHAATSTTDAYTGLDGDEMTFGNKVMRALGVASVAYTLGTTDAKVLFNDKVCGIF